MLVGHLRLNLIPLKNVFTQLHHHINFKLYQPLTYKNFLLCKNNKILLKISNFYLQHKTLINHHALKDKLIIVKVLFYHLSLSLMRFLQMMQVKWHSRTNNIKQIWIMLKVNISFYQIEVVLCQVKQYKKQNKL